MHKCWIWMLLLWLPGVHAWAQQDTLAVIRRLVDLGFENVRMKDAAGERIYTLEDNTYKLTADGIAIALACIQQVGLNPDKPNKVIVTQQDVPQLAVVYLPQVEDWYATYDVGTSWDVVRKERKWNTSKYRINLLLYPQLSFENLVVTQIYYVLLTLNPTVEVSLWPGAKFTAQLKVPLYNDGYGPTEGKVHPGFVTLSQRFRLPWYEIRGKVTAGLFNADRYGVDVQLNAPMPDPRFTVEARAGLVGIGYWNGMKLHYDVDLDKVYSLGGGFYWPAYNTQFKLTAQKWLLGDKGLRFDMISHFRHFSLGLYAMKATDSAASANFGFRFQLALPPYTRKKVRENLFIGTSRNMGMIYNAGNERYYYKEYKAEASDNIMEANGLNPLYLQREWDKNR